MKDTDLDFGKYLIRLKPQSPQLMTSRNIVSFAKDKDYLLEVRKGEGTDKIYILEGEKAAYPSPLYCTGIPFLDLFGVKPLD